MAREEVRRGEAKMLRGELGRLVRWLELLCQVVVGNISFEDRLVARLLNGELKRGKTFRRKARRGQEGKGTVSMLGELIGYDHCIF